MSTKSSVHTKTKRASNSKLNWLRAAVLGANDGIVSIAGLVLGVAGATNTTGTIFTAGLAGIIAGAISMAAGEYVSVSSSRDAEKAILDKELHDLKHYPKEEFDELVETYIEKGLTKKTALQVVEELTAHDPVKAHYETEFGINAEELTNPWHAAFASATAFILGSIIPFTAILLPPPDLRIPISFIFVLIALCLTGTFSAIAGGANVPKAVARVVIGGFLAMFITYYIGKIFGTAVL